MKQRIKLEYEDAAYSVGYDSAEGGYQLPTMDGYDLLDQFGLGWDLQNEELMHALAGAFSDSAWVHRDPYSLTEEDARRISWEEFSDIAKHRVRYLLFPPEMQTAEETTAPSEMLDELGELFRMHDLVGSLAAGTDLFRVRIHAPADPPPNTLLDFGPPPQDAARFANRMSPAGMSMFYTALDRDTAIAETYVRHDGNPAQATIATFKLTEDLNVLNLVDLPRVPSIFDSDEANLYRATLNFIHQFRGAVTEPVAKDGREHTEYVPSQIVTEYVRYRLAEKIGKRVHGILYPSSRRAGGVGCVLFVAYEDLTHDRGTAHAVEAPFALLEDRTQTIDINTEPA